MFNLLKSKKVFSWCLFDFGISSFPTLILTFFYGAYYAKYIASNPIVGTSSWGFAISVASILSFIVFSFILIQGNKYLKDLNTSFFKFFFYLMAIFSASLSLFDKGSSEFLPLVVVVISFICFEIVNLFYNISLHKVSGKNNQGLVSNFGWGFGYLGGLISLVLVFVCINLLEDKNFEIFGTSIFLWIGPFVGIWSIVFGIKHLSNFKKIKFKVPNLTEFFDNIRASKLPKFLISYFFFNNAVICVFVFASMFASFLFGLKESQILFLGIFINLFGIVGCLTLGWIEDKVGSEKIVKLCIVSLMILTLILYFTQTKTIFWIIALIIGFFVGPIQASSRSVLVKKISSKNQLSAFLLFSIFGNICAILGPFLVGIVIDISTSIRLGLLVIPAFFFISLLPYILRYR